MAANIPGAERALPGAYSELQSITQGVSVPSGSRVGVIIGEGARSVIVVSNAQGGGNDGVGADGNLTGTPDGRHFYLGGQEATGPLIENRTRIFKNGVPLTVLEEAIDDNGFDNRYDVRVDIENGFIELQAAHLVDQGGSYYRTGIANTGNGTIDSLTLIDPNTPAETWTARCTTIRRDGYGNPVSGYAHFVVRGSVSGILLDGYGNQITWQSDSQVRSNGVLQFAISEGVQPFVEGDSFVIQVTDGALVAGDTLTAQFIAVADINDPVYFEDINSLTAKHGRPSTANRLSLGAQLAFANGTPGVYAVEAAPALPRRISYTLVTSSNGEQDEEELTFPLPLGVTPDSDSNINFFVRNPITGVERQIIPNKVDFFNPTITANPSSFIFGGDYEYSYTVVQEQAVVNSGNNGELVILDGTTASLHSASVIFNLNDLSGTRTIQIVNATNPENNGVFAITAVVNGNVTITAPGGFVAEAGLEFQVLDSATTSSRILWTEDLALTLGESLRATVVDDKDADFFDPGWISAYEACEAIEVDMVCPLPSQTISTIFQNGKVHVTTQSNILNRHERILFIGAIAGLKPENVIGTEPAAVEDIGVLEGIQGDSIIEILAGDTEDLADYGVQNNYGDSYRVFYFYPDEIVVQTGSDRITVDGFFMAAAALGYFSGSSQINEPLTNKTLAGFNILRTKLYSPRTEQNLAASGITVVRPLASGGLVLWGKSTTNSLLPEEEEMSVVFIRDRISKDIRLAFQPYIGKAETQTTTQSLYARATQMMRSFLSRRLITRFKNLVVERDPVEPRQWNVRAEVMPVFGVNWVYIRFGVGVLE